MRAEIYCSLSLSVCFWNIISSAWSDDTNTILYGLVIATLFFIGRQSIIYHWQCSWGLMMHNSVGVVWHTAPAEGIWKVIRAINPKFFSVVCHDALQQPVVMTVPACSLPLPLSVSRQKNNTTCLSCQLIRWNLIAQPQKFKAGNCFLNLMLLLWLCLLPAGWWGADKERTAHSPPLMFVLGNENTSTVCSVLHFNCFVNCRHPILLCL